MKNKSSLSDWLNYIETLHVKSIDLGLERIQSIAIELDLLHPAAVVILVGGTNGKGTTCCLLESILLACGISVGVYSSPHLLSFIERVRINGMELREFDHVESMIMIEKVRSNRLLSYFEFITLSSLYLLKSKNLDVVLLEVGLGGRLDATNVVNPDISIITNVAIDHTDVLGCDYMSIAKEKFGIFRFCKPAIVGDFIYPDILRNIICDQYGVIPFIKNQDWWYYISKKEWNWWSKDCTLDALPIPRIPVENAAIALSTIPFLPFSISRKMINDALKMAILPGRFQIVSRDPIIILDVAHNPHAAIYLSNRLKMMNILGVFRIVIGMLSNKNICDTLCAFNDLVPVWYFSSLDCSLGASSSQLRIFVRDCINIQEFNNVCDAFRQALLEARDRDCIVVCGSFHTVAPVLRLINKSIHYENV